ncbi:MAG: limonene-1,2-epoxide hydrolase family protein [Novosphingobium sp.]
MSNKTADSPETIVRQLFLGLENEGAIPTFEKWLHPEAIWQNTGFPDAVGKPAILDLARRFLEAVPAPFARIEILHISSDGDVVLTERVDHVLNDDKSLCHSSKIMGAFEVKDGLIKRWSDYFNPSDFPIAD